MVGLLLSSFIYLDFLYGDCGIKRRMGDLIENGEREARGLSDLVVQEMMRIIRERYRMAFNWWVKNDTEMTVAVLKAVMKDTVSLIEYLEKRK